MDVKISELKPDPVKYMDHQMALFVIERDFQKVSECHGIFASTGEMKQYIEINHRKGMKWFSCLGSMALD